MKVPFDPIQPECDELINFFEKLDQHMKTHFHVLDVEPNEEPNEEIEIHIEI